MKKIFTLLAYYANISWIDIRDNSNKPSMYSVKIINLQTSQQSILLPKSMHQPGVGSYQFDIASGIYVIAVLIDENINAKKIIVK